MEIGKQRIDHIKFVTGVNKDIRLALIGVMSPELAAAFPSSAHWWYPPR